MALGEKLCNARLARKESASDVAAATRMKVQIVEAIEREDFLIMSAPIYAKGFIRLYAEHVGLDPKPLIEDYMTRYADTSQSPRAARLQDGKPIATKILKRTPEESGSAAGTGGTADAPPPPDLVEAAPPAPELGAPPVPRFQKPSRPLVSLPTFDVSAFLRHAAAAVSAATRRLAERLRAGADLRQTASGLLASVPARVAVGVAAVLIVVLAISTVSRCSAPAQAPAGGGGDGAIVEPIELAVEPPAPYID